MKVFAESCEKCGQALAENFAERVRNHVHIEAVIVNEGLCHEGPILVDRLAKTHGVRGLSRLTGLSPTYLSRVRNSRTRISPWAFLRIAALESKGGE